MSELLFAKYDWPSAECNQLKNLRKAINNYDGNKLLNTSTEDLCEYFFERFSVTVPNLKPAYIPGAKITINIPFEGDGEVFNIRPTSFSLSPPRATISRTSLQFEYTGESLDASRVKSSFDSSLQEIEGYLNTLIPYVEIPRAWILKSAK